MCNVKDEFIDMNNAIETCVGILWGFCFVLGLTVPEMEALRYYAASHFFFPFVLSKTSIQCLFTPLFSSAFTTASFCGP